MKIISDIGIQIPQVYLPKPGVDLNKWAVIACDQFTSEPEYWNQVEKIVGDAPSTLNLTFPEVHLEKPGKAERIESIQSSMRKYLDAGILQAREGLIYVERTVAGKTRKGILLALDLERYDYNKGSTSSHPRHRGNDCRTPASAHADPRRRGVGIAAYPGVD